MPKLSQEDRDLFREAVKKLNIASLKKTASTKPIDITLYDKADESISPSDALFYSRGGLQHKTLKDLRTGKIAISAEMDLHGMTVEESRKALLRFIQHALRNHYRCVRIIHGKGKILKNHIGNWLQQIDPVLAFSSAIPKHGGTGAVYVILKHPSH